jgi:hypothetical protein
MIRYSPAISWSSRQAGVYSDTLRGSIAPANYNQPWSLAHEVAGNHTVEVFVTGYHPWAMSDVVVPSDDCHAITRTLNARLQPL